MKVQDVMTTDVATTGPTPCSRRPPMELVRRRISGMPVVERRSSGARRRLRRRTSSPKESGERRGGGFLQWLVDPGDPWIAARFDAVTVGEAMSTPARTITPDRPLAEAATIMLDEDINRLPVVDPDGTSWGSSAAETWYERSPARTTRSGRRSRRTSSAR